MSALGTSLGLNRADRLADLVAGRELDALLVTGLVGVRYLTGFTGSNGIAVVGPRLRRFVTDFRYVEQAAAQAPDWDRVRAQQDLLTGVEDVLPAEGPVRLGFEDAHMTIRQHARLRGMLPDRVELVPAGDLVEELRAVKDADEVARIRAAAALADSALTWVLEQGVVGRTEREVASALEQRMRELGAEGPSFDSIVAHGAHGALPHAQPREVPIAAGTLIIFDWGARLDGYCSDCTRTFATGEVGEEERTVYELVQRAQAAGLDAVSAGVMGRDADAAARQIIEAGGHGERFGHGLGHGVGLEVHEPPRLARTSEAVLAAGNVVSVEPGVYLPGRFGVRIEDLVVVTDDGADVLNGLGKDLVTIA